MIIWLNLLILVLVAGDLALLLAYYREVKDNQRLQAANDYLNDEVLRLHRQLPRHIPTPVEDDADWADWYDQGHESKDGEG